MGAVRFRGDSEKKCKLESGIHIKFQVGLATSNQRLRKVHTSAETVDFPNPLAIETV